MKSYYEMKNGLVVMQAEDGAFVYSNNSANSKWKETTQFAGEEGSVMLWTGDDYFNRSNGGQKQVAPLEYHFEVDEPGTYYLTIRGIKPDVGAADRNNDFFVQFEDGPHEKIFFAGGAPNLFRWAAQFDPGHGQKKIPATFNVTEQMIKANDGVFTLTLSARSELAGFDEIHIKKGSASRDADAPTSKLIKGDGNDGGDPPPPPPPPSDDNADPVAKNDAITTGHNKTQFVDVLKNDNDPDGDNLTIKSVSNNGNTSNVSVEGGKIKVDPKSDVTNERVEVIEYTVSDGKGGTDTATLSVTVLAKEAANPDPVDPDPVDPDPVDPPAGNKAPVAVNDKAQTAQNKTILVDVLANDRDPEGGNLKIVDVSYAGDSSRVTIEDNMIKVNPLKRLTDDRVEVITYTVEDNKGAQSKAILRVDIGNPDDSTVEPIDPPVDEPVESGLLDLFIADAGGDKIISSLKDGAKISLSALTDDITFFATSDDADAFAFVELSFEEITRKEKVEPYALFGDKNGDFNGGLDLDKGTYSIVAKGYDQDNNLIETVDIDFAIV